MSVLKVLNGRHAGSLVQLGRSQTIGSRSGAQVPLKDPWIGWNHARVIRQQDDFILEDLNSAEGTFVNGEQLKRLDRRSLHDGDLVRLGRTSLRYIAQATVQNGQLVMHNGGGGAHGPTSAPPPSPSALPDSGLDAPAAAPADLRLANRRITELERNREQLVESLAAQELALTEAYQTILKLSLQQAEGLQEFHQKLQDLTERRRALSGTTQPEAAGRPQTANDRYNAQEILLGDAAASLDLADAPVDLAPAEPTLVDADGRPPTLTEILAIREQRRETSHQMRVAVLADELDPDADEQVVPSGDGEPEMIFQQSAVARGLGFDLDPGEVHSSRNRHPLRQMIRVAALLLIAGVSVWATTTLFLTRPASTVEAGATPAAPPEETRSAPVVPQRTPNLAEYATTPRHDLAEVGAESRGPERRTVRNENQPGTEKPARSAEQFAAKPSDEVDSSQDPMLPRVQELLAALAAGDDALVQRLEQELLYNGPESLAALAIQLRKTRDDAGKKHVRDLMVQILDELPINELGQLVESADDPTLKTYARMVFAKSARPEDLSYLNQQLREATSPEQKKAIINAIQHVGTAEAFDSLHQIVTTSDDRNLQLEAVRAISTSQDNRAQGVLFNLAGDAQDPSMQIAAINSLSRYNDRETAGVLINVARGSTDDRIRSQAILSLGKSGGQEDLPFLEEMLQESNPRVRYRAKQAIHRINRKQGSQDESNYREVKGSR